MRAQRSVGFSFIELIATLAIIGVLLLIVIPSAQTVVKRHRETELRLALTQIRGAIDHYKKAAETGRIAVESGSSGYPPNLEVLSEGVVDVSSPSEAKIYFLRRLPADPFHPGTGKYSAETWGLRSYESPPDAPEAGEDVFDVYSTSAGVGLNGIAYREW
ncbi:type II secretion system protein [Pseudoxanthomonas sacheonensis]|uniref:General secretion pathway protein G n=1 Tax=Pseudoxanthomonas sacheonensis TaxID=443615 RepID=A0ABU1RQU0_9GAMM|nr:type II secretion system protein [Pseudoxanthomonas sacheonensis]MDR6841132.1 general secretion pathway protein G [Pseudoxanthomonas sacheonensis]